jgi:hypothetical protein
MMLMAGVAKGIAHLKNMFSCVYCICLQVTLVEPHFNLMVKSGTDFRDMTLLTIELPPQGQVLTPEEARKAAAAAVEAHEGLDELKESVSDGIALASGRATVKWQHIQITGKLPDDEETAKVRRIVFGSR